MLPFGTWWGIYLGTREKNKRSLSPTPHSSKRKKNAQFMSA
jgi:hypothetical protein